MRRSILLFALIFYALTVAINGSVVHKNNGRPGCQTQEELQVVNYRHFWNKSAYWKCVTLGEPALIQYCPPEQGYLDPVKACVPWSQWYWTHTDLPPSQPSA